jgi:hypothetical protein
MLILSYIVFVCIAWFTMIKPFQVVNDIAINTDGVSVQALEIVAMVKTNWLLAPIILVGSLIIWGILASTRRDYQQFSG